MGLDTSHNCWHGPYSAFNRFRYALARQININLKEYDGYDEGGTKSLESIQHDIMPLLNHSDCDGELTPAEAARIASGLQDILDNFKPDPKADLGFREDIVQFRDGCLLAASKNEVIDFH